MSKPKLSYFSARGIIEPIRLLLADAQVDYIKYDFGMPTAEGLPAGLLALKASGDLDYGSVPLWEEEGLKLVQSNTILRHLARVYGYNGENEFEASKIDAVVEGCWDFNHVLRSVITTPAEQKLVVWKDIVEKEIPKWLGFFEALLQKSGTVYLVGNKLSYADIVLASFSEEMKVNKLGLDAFPLLSAHLKFVYARPHISKYVSDPDRYGSSMHYIP